MQATTTSDRPRIIISGSSGFIGAALIPFLEKNNYQVVRLVRKNSGLKENESYWNPAEQIIDRDLLNGAFAVISLGGENIAARRWSASFKNKMEESRTVPTKFLADTISQLEVPPKVWLSASAIGFYGDRGAEELTEVSPAGSGFLANLVRKWETASFLKDGAGTRVANLRFGIVLGKGGGALSKMLLPFSLGLGAVLGDGKNYMSWIELSDLTAAVLHILRNDGISGPINITSPTPVTNREFSKTFAKVLRRPCFLKVPPFMLRLLIGEMADQALLASERAIPKKLIESKFSFRFGELSPALESIVRGNS